jgi:CDP-diacylglycerol--serine O-phosphatidyltransferase
VAPWVAFVALLMVSSIATYSWSSVKLRSNIRFEAIALVVLLGAAIVSAPWHTLSIICVLYLISMPFSIASYSKIRRQRSNGGRVPEPTSKPSA